MLEQSPWFGRAQALRLAQWAQQPVDGGWQLGSALARSPGFVATVAVEDGSGVLITISLFEDLVSLAGAAPLADPWTAEHRA